MPEGFAFRDLRYPGDGSIVSVDTLEVGADERSVVFGPNGSGKTTLLRLLAGTIGAGTGVGTAYLPQRPYLFRGTGQHNLGLGLSAAELVEAADLAVSFGVADRLDADVRELSGGERMRLALARTLAKDEPLVLLDEPLAPLDHRDRERVAAGIARALQGRSAVIVSHDRESVAILADRVAILIGGRFRQVGPVGEVFAAPSDDDVAEVVGVANVLDGHVTARSDPLVTVRCGEVDLFVVGDQDVGTAVKVIFGAEAVSVHTTAAPGGSPRNVFSGSIRDIRHVGRLVELVADVGVPVVALITPGSLDAMAIESGTRVYFAIKATAARAVAAGSSE
jgi:ABC-type Fe3+/spermidine/putrescine transport system ATPase subunit